ncbi:MAG: 2-dehydropantoate 2-reductase, partial [Candidatus Bathyarchaeota archaeon]
VLEKRDAGERIAALFNESGLKARASSRIDWEIWNKLIVNCVVNPLTAILQARDNEVVVDTLRQLRHGIVDECVEVGQREGMTFKSDLKKSVDRCISRFANRSSMYQDIIRGKKTEIDFLNGKIVKLGSKYDIPTPINKALVSMIKFLERKR